KVWADRSLFYLSKMYVEQIEEGQQYDAFKRCVSISILDFTLFHDTDEFYSCFHLREDTSDILLWAKFISAEREEEFDMLATKNPYIKSAYE
uniref:PD-(D/E)XK nuclease family transposase n=1 Tax=Agathobacter sp. TaxID=2021311 RepID=UPI004056C90C